MSFWEAIELMGVTGLVVTILARWCPAVFRWVYPCVAHANALVSVLLLGFYFGFEHARARAMELFGYGIEASWRHGGDTFMAVAGGVILGVLVLAVTLTVVVSYAEDPENLGAIKTLLVLLWIGAGGAVAAAGWHLPDQLAVATFTELERATVGPVTFADAEEAAAGVILPYLGVLITSAGLSFYLYFLYDRYVRL